MPPIPVHLDDPIVAQKAEGVTPQTSQQQQPPSQAEVATTTTATATSQAYPPARPGAAAVPAPTPYIPNPPAQPTRTTQVVQDGPPPPQPGAVPVPLGQQVATRTSALPPPPKAGEAARAREAGVTQMPTHMPPQMGMEAPGMNSAGTRSTATTVNLGPVAPTSTLPPPSGPAGVPTAPHRPPEGYTQDTNAQEMNAAQRSSLEELERRESVFANVGLGGAGGSSGLGSGGGGGGGEGVGLGAQAGETAASAWSAVKGVLGSAGEKLAEVEGDVWRRINGGK